MIQVIGITGKKFHGKDTLGNIFVSKYNFKRMAYADNLKEACRHIFGFSDEQLYGNLKEQIDDFWGVSPRVLFQFIGTDLFRNQIGQIIPNIKNDIWIKSVEKTIINESVNNPDLKIVITDIRFPNEVELIKKFNGKIIKIIRPDLEDTDSHISENYDIISDLTIINDQDLQYLEEQIDLFMEKVE
jgi:hypothetical protein